MATDSKKEMFRDPEISTASRDEIHSIQLKNLTNTHKHCYDKNEFYKKRIDESGLNPDKITDVSQISKLPFTSKDDLRDNYPFGLFCTPLSQVVRIHASSGTTGNPTVVGYTSEDLDIWAACLARIMYETGVRK